MKFYKNNLTRRLALGLAGLIGTNNGITLAQQIQAADECEYFPEGADDFGIIRYESGKEREKFRLIKICGDPRYSSSYSGKSFSLPVTGNTVYRFYSNTRDGSKINVEAVNHPGVLGENDPYLDALDLERLIKNQSDRIVGFIAKGRNYSFRFNGWLDVRYGERIPSVTELRRDEGDYGATLIPGEQKTVPTGGEYKSVETRPTEEEKRRALGILEDSKLTDEQGKKIKREEWSTGKKWGVGLSIVLPIIGGIVYAINNSKDDEEKTTVKRTGGNDL